MFVLIDNYDSFTYNLFHFLGELGAEVEVWRNDAIQVEEVLAKRPRGIVISPGPCDPDRAGICLDLVRAATGQVPLLGVCLGHLSSCRASSSRACRGTKHAPRRSKPSRGGDAAICDCPMTKARFASVRRV